MSDMPDSSPTLQATDTDAPPGQDTTWAAETESDRLVPVSEAIRYRKRAQAAEQQLAELEAKLQTHAAQLTEAEHTIAQLERRQRIDATLTEADPVDLGVARLLTEQAVAEMDEPDVAMAVADLKRHKPYLFRQEGYGSPAMAARNDVCASDPAEQAAERAIASGNRRDLLDYLKLRRRNQS